MRRFVIERKILNPPEKRLFAAWSADCRQWWSPSAQKFRIFGANFHI
jgi:hypothetical protein